MSSPFPPPGVKVLSVGELTRGIKQMLEEGFASVWVEGEVSNYKKHTSGHCYFTLKDEEAPLAAVMFRGFALRLRFDPTDGMKVIARGRLGVYESRGQYQLYVEELQPKGIGPLELAFRQLKEKLSLLGYFELGRKKRRPRVPRRVALITSPTGSAVRDMLETLGRRWPPAEVWVRPTRVQGDGAAADIAASLDLLNHVGRAGGATPIDVILLGRGGGNLEDLWPFNEEVVAHALYRSRIPVLSGVGHEDDYTIADMVADERALTPTNAAEMAVPDRAKVLEWLGDLEERFRAALRRKLDVAKKRLDDLATRRCFRLPLERVRDEERGLDEARQRLDRAVRLLVQQAEQRVVVGAARLESLSPLNVLARGYSLTLKEPGGALVRAAAEVQAGDRLVTVVRHGRIVSRVETVAAESKST